MYIWKRRLHASSALGFLKMNKRNKDNNETCDCWTPHVERWPTGCQISNHFTIWIVKWSLSDRNADILAKITTFLVTFYTYLVVKVFYTSEKTMKIYVTFLTLCAICLLFTCILVWQGRVQTCIVNSKFILFRRGVALNVSK